jgi:hypothetical protein
MSEADFGNVFDLNFSFEIVKSSGFKVLDFNLGLPAQHFSLICKLILLKNSLIKFLKLLFLGVIELHFYNESLCLFIIIK